MIASVIRNQMSFLQADRIDTVQSRRHSRNKVHFIRWWWRTVLQEVQLNSCLFYLKTLFASFSDSFRLFSVDLDKMVRFEDGCIGCAIARGKGLGDVSDQAKATEWSRGWGELMGSIWIWRWRLVEDNLTMCKKGEKMSWPAISKLCTQ